ncbi:hypothetical protein CACET_c22720 [Clostridium aceticum]|uniref:Uncharacterized protein n=1 Tax=Clostridium aceticum TaxID=84022 RepID=A0A0G3WBJ1_9CLOT|nr:hypothetical protein [Clostridium aceticum]AKL95718.1 hypothetical protein CACET_c22720 [Clostridium aceticum]
MAAFNIINIFLLPIVFIIPAVILYFIIKLAVKNAIKELKEDKTL